MSIGLVDAVFFQAWYLSETRTSITCLEHPREEAGHALCNKNMNYLRFLVRTFDSVTKLQ